MTVGSSTIVARLLVGACAMLAAGNANGQIRRRPAGGPVASSEVAASHQTSPPSSGNAGNAGASTRPPEASRAHASAGGGASSSGASSQVMVSNTLNRPGYHQTAASGEIFVGVGPGAWAWPFGGFLLSPGMRFAIPLTRNGPAASLNNDFRLVIGGQVYFSTTPIPYWWLSAPVTFQWNFFLSEQWSVVLEAGLAVDVFIYDLINCYDHPRLYCDRVFFHPAGAFGLRRHFSGSGPPGNAGVTFRFSYPGGVQIALGF